MSTPLVVCPGCSRHVFSSERACPFCSAPRASSGAVVALVAAAMLAGGAAHADPPSPRMQMQVSPAQGYGAPPDRPWERMGPVVTPVEAPAPRVSVAAVQGPSRAALQQVRRALAQRVASFGVCDAFGVPPPGGVVRMLVRAAVDGDGVLRLTRMTGGDGALRRCATERLEGMRVPGGAGVVRFEVQVRTAGGGGPARCGASPAGCARTGCGEGMVCDRRVQCVPSSCGCDPQTGQWTCTSDCGGGVCVPVGAGRLLR
jgi:hypothetical protein